MAIKKFELYSSLWASCDELRGGTWPMLPIHQTASGVFGPDIQQTTSGELEGRARPS